MLSNAFGKSMKPQHPPQDDSTAFKTKTASVVL